MGGASVQIAAHGYHASLNIGRKEAAEAAQLTFGNDKERPWIAVSGLYYMACDNSLPTEKPVPIREILAKLESCMTLLHDKNDAQKLGSATCAYAVLTHLHGT